jgi:hypothetical protein
MFLALRCCCFFFFFFFFVLLLAETIAATNVENYAQD